MFDRKKAVRPARARILNAGDRINIAVIGCGGMGTWHVKHLARRAEEKEDIRLVAICDLFEKNKEIAQDISELPNEDIYGQYGEVLDRPDVDACWVATPDHWHAQIAIEAMRAGKDVYLEKPMTKTIEEARDVARVVEETGAVLQVGVQGTTNDRVRRARGAIESGAIGKVVWSQSSSSRNYTTGAWSMPDDPDATEAAIDWKTWLGSTPYVPFDRDRFLHFRKYWNYSGGIATDLFYHRLSELSAALGPEFPHRVTGTGGTWIQKERREIPDTYFATFDYPSEHSVIIAGSMANSLGMPRVIRGHEATLDMDHPSGISITPQQPFAERFKERHGTDELVIPSQHSGRDSDSDRVEHISQFLECVRTRAQPRMPAAMGYRVMVAIAMSVMSFRQGKMLYWDAKNEKVVDSDPGRA